MQTAVAGVAARALGWESVMHYLDLWDHKHPAEAVLTAQDCKPPWICDWVWGGGRCLTSSITWGCERLSSD